MRSVITASVAVTGALVVANMLGVASAEAPTGVPGRTVSVEGVAMVPIAQGASLTVATSAYRQGMAAALADGQSKAEFLSSKAGTALATVQSIVEGGGSIGCVGGEESGYVEYQGEQPDFGSPNVSIGPVQSAAAPALRRPAKKHRKKTSKAPSAKKAAATTCTLTAQVSLVYSIG